MTKGELLKNTDSEAHELLKSCFYDSRVASDNENVQKVFTRLPEKKESTSMLMH